MKSKLNLPSLTIDELWALHEEVGSVLSQKLTSEKRELEERLAKLSGGRFELASNRQISMNIGVVGSTHRYYPSFGIQMIRRKHGPVVGNSRAGWCRSLKQERRLTTF